MSEEIRYSISKIKSRHSWDGLAYWSICFTDSSVYFVLFGILRSLTGREARGALKDIELTKKSVIQTGETLKNILSRAEQYVKIPLSEFTGQVQYRRGLINNMVFVSKKGDLNAAEEILILKMRHKHFKSLVLYTKNIDLEFKKVMFTKKIQFETLKPFLIILALIVTFFGVILFEDKKSITTIDTETKEKTGVMIINTENKTIKTEETNNDPAQSVLVDQSMFYNKNVVSYQSDDGTPDGIVKYNSNGIEVFLDLNAIPTVPDFSLYVGKVTEIGLSPNNKFLYIVTAQGGGQATFIYDIEEKKVYAPDLGGSGIPTWLTDGRLYVVAHVNFGPDYNYIQSVAVSNTPEEPWILSSLYSRED